MMHSAVFWLVIAMAVFFSIAGKPLVKTIRGMIDKHRELVCQEMEAAARLRNEAQELLIQIRQKHSEATKEAEAIIANAKADADRLHSEAAAKLEALLALREKQAMDKIAEAEAKAIAEARQLAARLSVTASSDILKQRMVGATADAMIDAAITELPAKLA